MKILNGSLTLSASDVSSAFSCHHRTALDLAVARKERPAPSYFDPMTAALQQRGLEHEKRYVDSLRARGLSVVELASFGGEQAVAATIEAMKTGVQAIVQASLQRGPWNGRADVLLRVERESALGPWAYEPVDTKLGRETRAASILQLALYAKLACDHLGALPERFCVVTPAEEPGTYREQWQRVDDFHAYFRFVRDALASATAQPTTTLLDTTYPEPVAHCDVCRWWESCDKRRRADDHLSLVAGITRLQRRELSERGVQTLAQLSEAPLPAKLKRGSVESFERVRKQARMQWLTRAQQQPLFELLPIDPVQGLCTLPLPSLGDVFLDIEGNPFAESGGREYLFGLVSLGDDGTTSYQGFWATTAAEERKAFETLMDLLQERWMQHPGMHVYHYAPYEPSALKRLMSRHATREEGLDKLLRGGRFVDLYRVIKNALIAGVERYSIKDLEIFYGFKRQVELRTASRMLRTVEHALELSAFDSLQPE
ncbi:MAG: RecB family nuclease, partial [Myxococcaceae bacterium]|nr:RecB family nuclease [Myxococcaceae bacterium]